MSDQSKLGLGKIITTEQFRDAIHVAVAPVTAGESLSPGEHVALDEDGEARSIDNPIGVVDPFLLKKVKAGERFWLFLYPGSITSLRHEWSHPAFDAAGQSIPSQPTTDSEKWMRAWAEENISSGYNYSDLDSDGKYEFALEMGRRMSVGPNKSARDSVTNEWWDHWVFLTKGIAQRDEYFSCSC